MSNKSILFEKYFVKYYNDVYRYLLRKLSAFGITNYQQAEDLAMDTFVSAYQKFEYFDENKASFATWIYVIANNKLKNFYRDNKVESELAENVPEQNDFTDDIVQAQYYDELRKKLIDGLKTLTTVQQKIIAYRYFYNKNSKEIAEIMGITSGNVRTQLSRAIKLLQKHFDF